MDGQRSNVPSDYWIASEDPITSIYPFFFFFNLDRHGYELGEPKGY